MTTTTTEAAPMTATERATSYGRTLHILFPATAGIAPATLLRRLRLIECELCRINEADCNYGSNDRRTAREFKLVERVKSILWGDASCWADAPKGTARIYFNGDPRGYALKIEDSWIHDQRRAGNDLPRLVSDWGGYGIVAPAPEDLPRWRN
jgi:hypothetical protein